ncbi:MAG: LLM class flavin-dependent oxidoreductase [Actinomycetota bacterium]|nr:LLM class flavin-dependent oxidoreductase [Actinomycetota bacterium]
MSDHSFRFGLANGVVGDPPSWTAAARRAESLGYSTILLPDTLRTPAPLPALAAAAAVTTTLRVGTWVLCDPLRNPRQLAWEAAGLQQLCGGRFELGIGAGRPDAQADCAELGLPFLSPGERINRLSDTLGLLRNTLPDTTIMVAASGPKLLTLAAHTADIIAFGWPPATDTAAARERIDIVRSAAGERAEDIELATGLIAVGDAKAPWLARMGTDARTLAGAGAITVLTGTARQMTDELQRRRDALGLSYVTVPADAAEIFAPVVAELANR